MINSSIVNAVLDEALRTGGDFSELYLQDTESNSLQMIDGKVENANYNRRVGAGVRVLSGTRSAYAYTADTSDEALFAAARAAASALKGTKAFEAKSALKIHLRIIHNESAWKQTFAIIREAFTECKHYF